MYNTYVRASQHKTIYAADSMKNLVNANVRKVLVVSVTIPNKSRLWRFGEKWEFRANSEV